MANIGVTLEHHIQQRYHTVSRGPGRRPIALTFGKFNLRYSPERGAPRIRVPLATRDITEALQLRKEKEKALNAAPAIERKPMLQTATAAYVAEIKATKKKRTFQNYAKSLAYFIESTGNKSLESITRADLLAFKVYLRDVMEHAARTVYNRFENTMTFLKTKGIDSRTLNFRKGDWPTFVEVEPEIFESDQLTKFFNACSEEERKSV